MVSDQEIASCVESLLSSGNSSAGAADTSFSAVLRGAEAKLGVDLSHKASFIRDQIDLLLGPRRPPLNPTPPPADPPPVQQQVQQQPQPVQLVQQPVQPVQVVQQPVQVTLPHPPPPAHLLFQPIPALQFINVGGGNMAARMATGTALPATGGMVQVGQVPGASGVGEGVQLGQMGQVPVAFYPPPPLAYRFNAYQAVPGQQAMMVAPQPVVQVTGSQSSDASKESGTGATKRKRGGPGGLNKICGVSPELQKIVGETSMSRTQIVKMLWAYIRANELQDPDDKRKIICNDQLKSLFDTDSTDMFKMNKLLSKHIIPLDSFELEARKRRAAEILAAKGDKAESSDQNSSSSSNFVLVSDELATFLGTEDKEMTRDDALKHVLDYVKANNLEDNENATIVCDAKLKELLGCDSLPSSGVRDMLVRHFIAES